MPVRLVLARKSTLDQATGVLGMKYSLRVEEINELRLAAPRVPDIQDPRITHLGDAWQERQPAARARRYSVYSICVVSCATVVP